MKTTRKTIGMTAVVLAAGMSFAFLPAAHAQTLTFDHASASSAAAAMSRRYGVTIVFRGSINTSLPVTFSIDNPDTPDGRLQAISSLASALDLDFQKVYVVSKIDPGAAVPPVQLDTNGPIVFSSTQISARNAIQIVASVDNAVTQISSTIDGNVTLPDTHMDAPSAAALIAKQTGTGWKAYYGLFRRGSEPDRLSGVVLDHTNGGQAIQQLPLLTYRSAAPTLVEVHPYDGPGTGASSSTFAPNVASIPNTNTGFGPDSSFGFGDPFGYTNPYGPYGYTGTTGYPVTTYAPGTVPSPVLNGAPTVPATGSPAAILPSFPYMGNVGQTTVGGY